MMAFFKVFLPVSANSSLAPEKMYWNPPMITNSTAKTPATLSKILMILMMKVLMLVNLLEQMLDLLVILVKLQHL